MGWYDRYILPRIIDITCATSPAMKQRQKLIPRAKGDVLEIGIGSGLNLSHYTQAVDAVVGVDPSRELWKRNSVDPSSLPFDLEYVQAYAERLPLDKGRFDTVVITYTLCTLPNLREALDEMRRVLKPGGQLLFCEHGLAPDPGVRRWQNGINPIWKRLGGGCNLNRNIPEILRHNGLIINDLDQMYIPGWKPASYNYWGSASKAN